MSTKVKLLISALLLALVLSLSLNAYLYINTNYEIEKQEISLPDAGENEKSEVEADTLKRNDIIKNNKL